MLEWLPVVRARVVAAGGGPQPGQEVRPAFGMPAHLGVRQAGMAQVDPGAAADRRQPELDPRRSGRQQVAAGESPGDDHATRMVDLQVLAAHRIPGDVDRESTARGRVEVGVLTHPGRHARIGGEVVEHCLGRRRDVDGVAELSHDRHSPEARSLP